MKDALKKKAKQKEPLKMNPAMKKMMLAKKEMRSMGKM